MQKYDLVVIGSGPAGEKAAVKAAYFLKKVALIEKSPFFGGGATYYTVPSKALREFAKRCQGQKISKKRLFKEFMDVATEVKEHNSKMVHANLLNHGVDIYKGTASFVDANHIEITNLSEKNVIFGNEILLANGMVTLPSENIPVDGKKIHTIETLLNIKKIPSSLCIYGAGVIACEFATIFSNLGCEVHMVDERPQILQHVDQEITQDLMFHMKASGIHLHLDLKIISVISQNKIHTVLSNGEIIETEMLLVAGRRRSQIESLNYKNAGIQLTDRGMISVNKNFQTNISNIYAVGDVIGPPGLVNTGMDQGRYAVTQMYHLNDMKDFSLSSMPQGIYTIPEISSVGLTEEAAIDQGYDVLIGKSYHSDIARGIIKGLKYGMMKLVIDKKTKIILGVHIIGNQASELIHYGVDLVANRKTLDDIIVSNFNFPCLHELFKYAAYDGLSTLTGRKLKKHTVNQTFHY